MFEIIVGGFLLFLILKILFFLGFGFMKIIFVILGLVFFSILLPIGIGLIIPIVLFGILLHLIGALLGILF